MGDSGEKVQEWILVVDFGSQLTQLIARRLRDQGVYAQIQHWQKLHPGPQGWWSNDSLCTGTPKGIILSGGPSSVLVPDSPRCPPALFDLGVPMLGICYGQQVMTVQLGGKVEPGEGEREFGEAQITVLDANCPLLPQGWTQGNSYPVWMSHGDRVTQLPPDFRVYARSEYAPFAVAGDETRKRYSVMFHPEATHTPQGDKLLWRFAFIICQCTGSWKMNSYRDMAVQRIQAQVGPQSHVLCALSGGVDSSVAAVLCHSALGKRLHCVLVDHGLMRHEEAKQVREALYLHYPDIQLTVANEESRFLQALQGETDPEKKRKIIGQTFVQVFEQHAKLIQEALPPGEQVRFLLQGTIYPDIIESHGAIKSHHNVGGLPEKMHFSLLEPLCFLFKDEVRRLGTELGLPVSFIQRHPFPGPGLALRIPGTPLTKPDLDLLRRIDNIFIQELKRVGLYTEIWQAFALLLPVQTVGVMGDARTYERVCSLRAVTSSDGMTAEVFEFPPGFLKAVSKTIINQVPGVNRVVYDCTSKPPGTIEWE